MPQDFRPPANPRFAASGWLDDKYQDAIKELIEKEHLACEELTKKQLAEVIRQALACGDLMIMVSQSSLHPPSQCAVYIPYADEERLRSRVRYLEGLLKQNGIEEPDANDVV